MLYRLHSPKNFGLAKPSTAAAVLMGALLLASPLASAWAQSDTKMAEHASKATARAETIEQRITTLHDQLKITPAEESDWQVVAQTMRDNASAMEKLAAEKAAQSQQGMSAVQDLQTYSEFAQAHVAHLQKLTSAFTTLYSAMPADQKTVADQVFERSRQQAGGGQG